MGRLSWFEGGSCGVIEWIFVASVAACPSIFEMIEMVYIPQVERKDGMGWDGMG